jgi:glycosyltransferase involved in cell wall biosynthesis
MDSQLVSIVMATRNAEHFLPHALDSIAAQEYQNYEVIVIDGRSIDRTRAIAASYPRTRIIEQDGSGFAQAWNCGIDNARGDIVAFLDSDDIWPKCSLARRVTRLASDPAIDCVVGRVRFFLEEGHSIPRGFKPKLLDESHVAYMPGVAILRRRVFRTLGRFEENWQIASDIVWFAKLRDSGARIDVIDDVLLYKRIHSSNLSNVAATMPVYREELLALAKQSISRQRASRDRKRQS